MANLYSSLDAARNEIRIAILQPGSWNDDIQVQLEVVSLDDKPEYTAVSYVWGDSSSQVIP